VTGSVEVERAGRMDRFVSIWMCQKRTRKWFDLIKTQQQQLSHQNIRLTTRSSSLFLLEKPLTQFIGKSKTSLMPTSIFAFNKISFSYPGDYLRFNLTNENVPRGRNLPFRVSEK